MGVVRRFLWKEEPVVDDPGVNWGVDATSAIKQNSEDATSIEYNGDSYTVQCSRSIDSRWTAAYGRNTSSGTIRGFVLHEGELVWTKTLERPFASAVAADGTSMFLSDDDPQRLGATLNAYDPSGQLILEDPLASNCSALAITDDGRYGALVTKRPNSQTHVYDLAKEEKIDAYDNVDDDIAMLKFTEKNGTWRLYASEEHAGEPLYAIETNGNVVWQSKRLIERTPYISRLLSKYRK